MKEKTKVYLYGVIIFLAYFLRAENFNPIFNIIISAIFGWCMGWLVGYAEEGVNK